MSTPKYIRVAGQLYRQREETSAFIKHAGWIYRLAETAVEHDTAIEALSQLSAFSKKISEATKDATIAGLMKQAAQELSAVALKIAKGDFDEKSAALKDWANLKDGLAQFATQLQQANLPKLGANMAKLVDASDKALNALQKAEGLGAEFGSPGGTTTPVVPSGKPGVDWGEYAPQKAPPQPQQLQASAVPNPYRHAGAWYRPLLPITQEGIAWATSTDPVVVAEHKTFDPLVVHLLASGL